MSTRIPIPGSPVRGSKSGAPIMALFDLLGRRWAMGVLWTLAEAGTQTFRALQERCESISPAVLNQRLKELQAAGFVTRDAHGYLVTKLGRVVFDQLVPLGATARTWAKSLDKVDTASTPLAASASKSAHTRRRPSPRKSASK